ncbi:MULTISPECIES: SDR family oxidoreductase [Paenibacillus]|uniref:SDR family oxidoreductase n=1 Tax=Paenibacillus radicis (ex Xue et al. 2023) TaxID=2972489 RepID=A0ABT1YDP0_9BACL|nr:SDR family oxidoreductase [Paenibacillus radicis (ex Xue et al. 2023)]MCR8631321.1 SDR family oxidoreductase [Paenibacillus radicis (ex Xue et al. 2023)]
MSQSAASTHLAEGAAKIALITGGNKGIGLETARQLGARGFAVVLGARNRTKGEEAASALRKEGIEAYSTQLDVTHSGTIARAVRQIEEQFTKLDVLVNNAGVFLDNAPPSQLDSSLLRQTFETNFFGMFAVTQGMLPLLRKSEAGRIVNMSSGLGSLTQNCDPEYEFAKFKIIGYNSSKTAVNALTIQFAYELKDTAIKINAADPGYTATDMNDHQGDRTVQQAAVVVVRLATLPDDGPTGGFFDENGVIPW